MNKSTTMDCRKNSQKMRSLTRTSALSFTLTVAFLLIATIHIVGAHDKSHHQQQDTAKNLNIRHQQLYDSIHYRGKRQDEQPTSSIAPDNVETTTNIPNDDKPAGTTTESSTTTSTTTTTTTTTTTKKPKTSMTVNYTQVDELFNMGYADEFVVAKWKNMSTGLQQGKCLIRSIVILIERRRLISDWCFPTDQQHLLTINIIIVGIGTNYRIDSDCKLFIIYHLLSIYNFYLQVFRLRWKVSARKWCPCLVAFLEIALADCWNGYLIWRTCEHGPCKVSIYLAIY